MRDARAQAALAEAARWLELAVARDHQPVRGVPAGHRLLGHLRNIVRGSNVTARIELTGGGAGRIGRAVALRSLGWGMRVSYVARAQHWDFELAPIAAAAMPQASR